jgi:ABC-type transporter MlaC component
LADIDRAATNFHRRKTLKPKISIGKKIVRSLISVAVLLSASAAIAQEPVSATDTVRAFLDLLGNGDLSAYKYWDVDAECQFIFGAFYTALSPADQKRLQEAMVSANEPYLSYIVELLKDKNYEFLGEHSVGRDNAEVELWVTAGQDKVYYLYLLHQSLQGWKIYRGLVNGSDLDVMLRITFLNEWQGLSLDEVIQKFHQEQ